MSEPGPGAPGKLNAAFAFACIPIVVGTSGLFGWTFDIALLKSIRPGMTAINPMTAVALLAIGLAVILHRCGRIKAGQVLGLGVAAIGVAKLGAMATGLPSIDGLLFAGQISAAGSGVGRMAPNTAGALALIGFAATLAGRQHRYCVASQAFAAIAGLLALFALVGYSFGVEPLDTIAALRPMALHTGLALIASAIALGSIHQVGLTAMVKDSGPAGALARTVLPLAIAIPIVVGGVRIWGQKLGFYGLEVGVSIQVIANVGLTCGLLAVAIFTISQSDKSRR